MRKISLLCASLLLSGAVVSNAQNFGLGIKGGVTAPNLVGGGGSPVSEDFKPRTGGMASLFAEFKVNDGLSIQPGIGYSSQGGQKSGNHAFATSGYLYSYYLQQYNAIPPAYMYADFKQAIKLDYLSIPVLAKYGWDLHKDSPFRFYVSAGPFVSILMRAHQESSGHSPVYLDSEMKQPITTSQNFGDSDIKGDIHRVNYGVEANLGLAYKVGVNSVFVEFGNNYGVRNIQKDAANGKNNTYTPSLSLGIFHTFGGNKDTY